MKSSFLNSSIKFIKNYNDFSEKDVEKLRYGLEGIYLTVQKLIVIIILSLILGIFKEVLITLILFNIIRFTGFGFHAEKSIQCLFISLFQFVILPYICIVSYILFAPADTVKRPLPNAKKRKIRKWSTVLIGFIYTSLIIIFFNTFITPLLLSALIIEVIVINPLTYMVFKQPYNNYKNFTKA